MLPLTHADFELYIRHISFNEIVVSLPQRNDEAKLVSYTTPTIVERKIHNFIKSDLYTV